MSDDERWEKLSVKDAHKLLDEGELRQYNRWRDKRLQERGADNMQASAAQRSEMAQKFIRAGGRHKIASVTVVLDGSDEFVFSIDLSKIDHLVTQVAELKKRGFDSKDVTPEQVAAMTDAVIDLLTELVVDEWADGPMWHQFAKENGVLTLRTVVMQIFGAISQDMQAIQKFR